MKPLKKLKIWIHCRKAKLVNKNEVAVVSYVASNKKLLAATFFHVKHRKSEPGVYTDIYRVVIGICGRRPLWQRSCMATCCKIVLLKRMTFVALRLHFYQSGLRPQIPITTLLTVRAHPPVTLPVFYMKAFGHGRTTISWRIQEN